MAGTKNLDSFGGLLPADEGRVCQFGCTYDNQFEVVEVFCNNDTMQGAYGVFVAIDESGQPIEGTEIGQIWPGKANEGDPPRLTTMQVAGVWGHHRLRPSPVNPNFLAGVMMQGTQYPHAG